MEKLSISSKAVYIILLISLLLNFYLLFFNSKETNNVSSYSIFPYDLPYDFALLDPKVAEVDVNTFLKIREEYIVSYIPLRENIKKIISQSQGHFGVYFEDLLSHSWIGINERDPFTPASLLKVTTVSAMLKSIEEGEFSLDTEVTLNDDDLNERSGILYQEKGSTLTLKKLIEIAIVESDNTAVKTLHRFMSVDRWTETRLAMGLPLVSVLQSEQGTVLTPKEFSNVFRSLYFSGYLRRQLSNWILSLMTQSKFNEGIPAGLPKEVKVAHKVGMWPDKGSVHDCGIVYAKYPYVLCIMSQNIASEEEGNRVIKEISQEVYRYVSDQQRSS